MDEARDYAVRQLNEVLNEVEYPEEHSVNEFNLIYSSQVEFTAEDIEKAFEAGVAFTKIFSNMR